ncbi:bacillithiol system redox-active protein YtxJ [Criblamydia sequanensis]|uniref:Thioredoxin n=1 Tax=Candidatus Criblamydia sequanensis CRIB-18 TaxID=1437425 RepID=A0A090D1C0_9BACT|nr:bacillithiol system redox-active protein YtxJ [Criblamydia sequanensis]CDR33715.1 Conserved hypothetical protein [Criblamydia sequanensis CRIB-18]
MKKIETLSELNALLQESAHQSVYFYKHSDRCSLCHLAIQEVQEFQREHPEAKVGFIDVLRNRDISNALAERSKIRHESPQIILYEKQEPVFHTSHSKITKEELERHYKS